VVVRKRKRSSVDRSGFGRRSLASQKTGTSGSAARAGNQARLTAKNSINTIDARFTSACSDFAVWSASDYDLGGFLRVRFNLPADSTQNDCTARLPVIGPSLGTPTCRFLLMLFDYGWGGSAVHNQGGDA